MKTLSVLTLIVVMATGSFAHAKRVHGKHAKHAKRRAPAPVDDFSAAQYLSESGIDFDQRQLDACAKERDPKRSALGQKPRFLGVMLKSFARSVCRSNTDPSKVAMLNGNPNNDAVPTTAYASRANGTKLASMSTDLDSMLTKEDSSLVETYTLLASLAGRESDYNFNEGRDMSRRRAAEHTKEAGAFQTSYDIHSCIRGSARDGLVRLERSYAGATKADCMNTTGSRDTVVPDASSGARAFQSALKNCPALALEHAAITVRQCKRHYGPLIRGEAKKMKACRPILESIAVQAAVNPSLCANVRPGGLDAQPTSISATVGSGEYDNLFSIKTTR